MANRKTEIAKTATHALKILWQEGLFRSWKKKGPIVEKLDKKGNHFSDAELGMALMRANHLTRRGKRGGYEYIQKYPYVADKVVSAKKEKAVLTKN
jgi:hypothetical protein